MKKWNLFSVLFMFVFCFTACDESNESGKDITVGNQQQLTQNTFADDTAGNSGVSFTTTGAWSSVITETTIDAPQKSAPLRATSASPSWISITPDSGKEAGDYTITITLSENTTGTDRSATITIICGESTITITVSQKGTTEDGEILDEPVEPNDPDEPKIARKVKKINGEEVIYGDNYDWMDWDYVTQIGSQQYTTKQMSSEEWIYVETHEGSRVSYGYNNDVRVSKTEYSRDLHNPESFETRYTWSGDAITYIRGILAGVSPDYYLSTDLEYGDTEYTLGNIDINWLLSTSSYYTMLPVSALVVKTTHNNQLLVKKTQIQEMSDGKYDAVFTYRYVFDENGYITGIYETSEWNGEQLIYEFEYYD